MELGSILRKIHAKGIDLVGSLGSVGTRAEGTTERGRERHRAGRRRKEVSTAAAEAATAAVVMSVLSLLSV
jgi:hypothetical protein